MHTILHTTQLLGKSDPFLLKIIDAVVWHVAQSVEASEVIVYLHPTRNPFNIVRFFLGLRGEIYSILRKLSRISGSLSAKDNQNSNLENRENSKIKGKDLKINLEQVCIIVDMTNKSLFSSPRQWIHAHNEGLKLFFQCFTSKGFKTERLLKIEYKGIVIGDLVASSTLRLRPYGGGSVRRSKLAVLEQLIDAAAFVNYINCNLLPLPDSTESSTIVMVREPTYLDAIYTRSLVLNGADTIEIYPYNAVYRKVNSSVYTPFRERVVNSSTKNLSPLEKMQVETYLIDRVYDPGRRLSYMKKGLNQTNTLKNERGELIHVPRDSSGAVLFLHSFDDAQYVFGPDGFDDLFDWSVFTLNSLLNNPDIDTVLIKPHPGVDYKNYPGDKRALKRLKKLFPETQKLKWLSHDCGPMALKDLKGFVGITHHGSIAEELVFLRVPVISSTYTPWSTNYQFTVNWSSPSEYGNLLAQNLNQFTVSQENIESLMAYVMEARLKNPITIRDCWPWYNYMEMLGFKSSGSFFEVFEYARNILSIEMFDLERLKIFFEYQYKKYLAR